MMNPRKMLELKQQKDAFEKRHPKFFPFIKAVAGDGLYEGSIMAITVTAPDGRRIETNLRLTSEDLELLKSLRKQA